MDRNLFTSATVGAVSGDNYMDNVAEKITALFNNMALIPTAITNSGNDYTITVDPVLTADVTAGMRFTVKPNATNTGPARIRVTSGNPYYDVVLASGEDMAADQFDASTVYELAFIGGEFRVLSAVKDAANAYAKIRHYTYLSSTTHTKPADLSADAIYIIECIGGGGSGGGTSGGNGGGGGGGGWSSQTLKASDVTGSVAVTVGAGGVFSGSPSPGGTSSFGSYCAAYGGGFGGGSGGTGAGGGGGGPSSAGGNASGAVSGQGAAFAGAGGSPGGEGIFGGGGGGSSGTSAGGSSFYGGGGGRAGGSASAGGVSVKAGNGGVGNGNGQFPGGGGGGGSSPGNGAAGVVRVIVIG